jgi:hypothetical protein
VTPIPYNETTAALVEKLILDADTLEKDIDEEHYSDQAADGRPRPAVRAAWAVRARPFARWTTASFTILRSVCGADEHPLCRKWLSDVHSPVVNAVRAGAGVLEGFLDAWKAGSLWPVEGAQ